jgi:hypothetical protein
MQKDPPLFTSAVICACISCALILIVVALCLSSCTMSQLKFWEEEAELLDHYAVDEMVNA